MLTSYHYRLLHKMVTWKGVDLVTGSYEMKEVCLKTFYYCPVSFTLNYREKIIGVVSDIFGC